MSSSTVSLIFPNQLFENSKLIKNSKDFIIIEEHLFFKQYNFHKQKLLFHRMSMKFYEKFLSAKNSVQYIDSCNEKSDIRKLIESLDASIKKILIYNPVDNWLLKRIKSSSKKKNIEIQIYENPLFILESDKLDSFFRADKKKFFQTSFYKKQRMEMNLLMNNGLPEGGEWTYDKYNREKYPKNKLVPIISRPKKNSSFTEAIKYIERNFPDNIGELSSSQLYPHDFSLSKKWLKEFLEKRFDEFGPYEDAILKEETELNHSILSPLINVGLLNPNFVVREAIDYAKKCGVPINSTEGFVRQIIGWREFIRGVYIAKGSEERNKNFWNFRKKMPSSFYSGDTGIDPFDDSIKKLLKTGYVNHIERLMIIGNFMLLCEINPDEVYKWFMELSIDSYDWVMVPNVYGMSQFADGGLMSTKPYISGSSYIVKMSNYKKGDWAFIWDSLFWNFINNNKDFFKKNPRMRMLVSSFEKMNYEKKKSIINTASEFLNSL